LNAESVIDFCYQIEGCLHWLEQPLPADDLMGFEKIREETTVSLMADESLRSYQDAKVLCELGSVDYFNIKLMKTGGMRAALKMIDLADTYGIDCYIGSMSESMLGTSMGCYTYLQRPKVVGTDLNTFELLDDQIADGIKMNKNKVIFADHDGQIKINKKKIKDYQL